MRPPIVLFASDEPLLFRSVAEAEAYAEPVDVNDGEYDAYDSAGLALEVTVLVGATRIAPRVPQVDASAQLVSRLSEFLRDCDWRRWGEAGCPELPSDLSRLTAVAIQYLGFTR